MAGVGEHTPRHACTNAAEECVKCVYCLFWDCAPNLTLLHLKFIQKPDFSVVGFKFVRTLDLVLIRALNLKVSVLTVTTGGLTYSTCADSLLTFHLYYSREHVGTGGSRRSLCTHSNMIGLNFSLQELLRKLEQVYIY